MMDQLYHYPQCNKNTGEWAFSSLSFFYVHLQDNCERSNAFSRALNSGENIMLVFLATISTKILEPKKKFCFQFWLKLPCSNQRSLKTKLKSVVKTSYSKKQYHNPPYFGTNKGDIIMLAKLIFVKTMVAIGVIISYCLIVGGINWLIFIYPHL